MPVVVPDSSFADWLKTGALYVTRPSPSAATWTPTGTGIESEIVSPLATRAAAVTEGDRQAAFMGGPVVKDRLLVPGARKDLYGKAFNARGDRLGYSGVAVPVYCIGAEELDNGWTALTVVRIMA